MSVYTASTLSRATGKAFDAEALRAQFPIFRQGEGAELAYLDNAASAQKPDAVIDAMNTVMTTHYANVHRGLHRWANATTDAYEGARASVARYLGAQSTDNIVWVRGSTEGLNVLARGLAPRLVQGDEIILSLSEHHANIVPWHMLREERGVVLKWVAPGEDGSLSLDAVEALITERTRIISLTHQSNVLGAVNDLAPICAMARARGIISLVDGSQSAVHLAGLDVQALGCDGFVCTGHKIYGPTGIGVLYATTELLDAMPPMMGGGEMIERVSTDSVTYAPAPAKFEAGTPAIVEAVGLGAAVEWLSAQDRPAIMQHEAMLGQAAREGLAAIEGVRVFGAPHSAIVAFHADWAHAHDLAQVLDHFKVAVRAGAHCAEPLMHHLGVTASARASFAAYNRMEDVERLLDGMARARKMFG
jgi:cysteine desulfurase/selenocysteine lyase